MPQGAETGQLCLPHGASPRRGEKDLVEENSTDPVLFDQVHKYLPERAKIPARVQKGKGGRHSKRGAVFLRKRFTKFDFPDIPDGFKPKGEERAVVVPEKVKVQYVHFTVDVPVYLYLYLQRSKMAKYSTFLTLSST